MWKKWYPTLSSCLILCPFQSNVLSQFRFFVVSAIMASVMAFAPSAMRSSRYVLPISKWILQVPYDLIFFSHCYSHTYDGVRSALRMSAAEDLASGATAPFGFFDPLGLSKVISLSWFLVFKNIDSSIHHQLCSCSIRANPRLTSANGVRLSWNTAVFLWLLPLASLSGKKSSSALLCLTTKWWALPSTK